MEKGRWIWRRAPICTGEFPPTERFGLVGQMRRAAVSVLSNVAEGAADGSTREFLNSLRIARGSLAELESQFLLAERLGIVIGSGKVQQQISQVGQLLSALSSSLKTRLRTTSR